MTRLTGCRGCGMLVSPGPRCGRCQRAWQRLYDQQVRPEHHALYRTAAWRRLAAEVTAGATRCTWCLTAIKEDTGQVVSDDTLRNALKRYPRRFEQSTSGRPRTWAVR